MSWPGTYFEPPPGRALRWVEKAVGPRASVVATRRMRGGTSSAVHEIQVRTATGGRMALILRRHVRLDVLQEEPWLAEREANHLRMLEGTSIQAPCLLAVDADGAECDVPAVLMTRLQGRLELQPSNIDAWLHRMAELLPPIHALSPEPGLVHPWEIWDDLRGTQPPRWSRRPEAWRALIGIVEMRPWPEYQPTFVHRDFQQFNVLWWRGRPSGIVDWMNASLGPRELDFGHFRYNLRSAFGFAVADRFLRIYKSVTGHDPDPFWEALNLGPPPSEPPEIGIEDMDMYITSILVRLM